MFLQRKHRCQFFRRNRIKFFLLKLKEILPCSSFTLLILTEQIKNFFTNVLAPIFHVFHRMEQKLVSYEQLLRNNRRCSKSALLTLMEVISECSRTVSLPRTRGTTRRQDSIGLPQRTKLFSREQMNTGGGCILIL